MTSFVRVVEVLVARVVPGAINLASIALLGAWLEVGDYGLFSTLFVTCAMVGNLLFGPVKYAIIPEHATYVVGSSQRFYERSLLGSLLLLALVSIIFCVLFSIYSLDFVWVYSACLVASIGLFDAWQSVLRARLSFWMYGMAYLAQSIALLSLLFVFKGALSVSMIIALFSISYAVGFLISWAVSGWIFPSMPSVGVLRNSIRIGIPLAMGNLAENLLYVGFRYVLLWFGGASMLGGFSFAVDLAQRTIGVVINVASFALVPRTFKAIAESSYKEFRWLLIRGSVVAAALGVCCAVFVLAMDFLGVSKAFGIEAYSPEFFVIASIAVLVNRLKKLLFDPLLISKGKASLIPVSYAVVGMASLLVAFILVSLKLDVWVLPLYSLSFLFVGFGSYLAVRKLTV